ncbi:holotricin-3-like isoform X3 [Portunus trituberculatus]|nr:holotricin-3-like isoform X3 [Portunus trituberculatus]
MLKVSLVMAVALALPCGSRAGGGYGGGGGSGFGGGHGTGGGSGFGGGYGGDIAVPIPYNFDYGVSAGNTNFGHSESGDGHGNAHGGYWVNLPDGRVQKVDYWADGGGYHPVVTYQGTAVFPAGKGGYGYH